MTANPTVRIAARLGAVSISRVLGAGAGFVAVLVLARLLDPDSLGRLFQAMSAAVLIGTLAAGGLPSVALRCLARDRRSGEGRGHRVLARGRRAALARCGLALAAVALALWLAGADPDLRRVALAIAPLAPAIVMLRFAGAAAIADRRPLAGYLPDGFVRPALLLAAVTALWFLRPEAPAVWVAASASVAGWFAVLVQRAMAGGSASRHGAARPSERRLAGVWGRIGWTALPSALVLSLMGDVIVLAAGLVLPAAEIAVLGVVLRLAFLAGFVIQALVQIAGPDLADAIARRDALAARRASTRTALAASGVGAAILVGAWTLGPFVLSLFGTDYAAGLSALLALAALQLARVPTAVAAQYLVASGRQGTLSIAMVAGLGAMVAAVLAGGAASGLSGVAIGALIVQAALSAGLCIIAWPRAGVRAAPTPVSKVAIAPT